MKTVDFLPPNLLGQKEGNATYELESISPSSGRILAYREKGSFSGDHWHEGDALAKNPEELLLVKGKVRIEWTINLEGNYEHTKILQAPLLIRVYSGVKHRLEALEDVCFIEFNSIAEQQNDTFYPKSRA